MHLNEPQAVLQSTEQRIEEKYYVTEGLLKETCDGNMVKAKAQLERLLGIWNEEEEAERLRQYCSVAQELNVLLCYKAHSYKVHPLSCEKIYKEFFVKMQVLKELTSMEKLLYNMVEAYSILIKEESRLKNSNLIRSCLEYIDSHYKEPLTLADEAKRLSVSVSYLSDRFSRETGMTFIEYLNDVRVRYACQLLEKLKLPIQQVAEWCGFNSSGYFSRVFHVKMGMSPSQYRAMHQK